MVMEIGRHPPSSGKYLDDSAELGGVRSGRMIGGNVERSIVASLMLES